MPGGSHRGRADHENVPSGDAVSGPNGLGGLAEAALVAEGRVIVAAKMVGAGDLEWFEG
jgi:hypothetical protein